ncbi:MAG TPA: fibronectin type III domain-containing protein [Dehalococcoidia bacterium]|nr:fibronectin type III domain-containing protein [Dehalococcoidia bacterium]
MMHHTTRLLIALPVMLAASSATAVSQLPERTKPSPIPITTTPTLDPRLPLQPPPVVQPGTILTVRQEPTLLRTRGITLVQAGEAPSQVQVTATGPRSVTLAWQAPANAIGYWIHQARAGDNTYYRGSSLVTTSTATVTPLLPGTTYSFKVSAVYPQELQRGEGMSAPVNVTTAPAPAPTGLAASVVGKGQVSLSWNPLQGIDGIRLFRNGASIGAIAPVSSSQGFLPGQGSATLATSFADSAPVGTHQYQIQAVYKGIGLDAGREAVSPLAPTPAVSVTIKASGRVRFCQTRAGASACVEPGASSPITAVASASLAPAGRRSP